MIVTYLCSCGEWPTPHDHTSPMVRLLMPDGSEIKVPPDYREMNPRLAAAEVIEEIPSEIRPAIDWKQFARELMTG